MPDIALLVVIAVAVVSAIIIFKVAKGLLQAILLVNAVLTVVAAVFGVFVIKDALDLKNNFQAQDNLLLISNDEQAGVVAGILVRGTQSQQEKGSGMANVEVLDAAELGRVSALFAKKDYASILGTAYKLIAVKEGAVISSVPESLQDDEDVVSREDVLAQVESSKGEERAMILAALLAMKVSKDPMFIISEYKAGNVVVYPETLVFKAIKLVPLSIFRKAAGIAMQKAGNSTLGKAGVVAG